MQESHSANEVVQALHKLGAQRVAIDGVAGSGKTTLAIELSVELKCPVFHLDDFVAKNLGAYIENLDTKRLSSALGASPSYVIEGVCLLQALESINLSAEALVYVKVMSHGFWSDEEDLIVNIPIDEHLQKLRDEIKPMADFSCESGELSALSEEVIRYHATYRPHNLASVIYCRTDA